MRRGDSRETSPRSMSTNWLERADEPSLLDSLDAWIALVLKGKIDEAEGTAEPIGKQEEQAEMTLIPTVLWPSPTQSSNARRSRNSSRGQERWPGQRDNPHVTAEALRILSCAVT